MNKSKKKKKAQVSELYYLSIKHNKPAGVRYYCELIMP